jgi:hypothetical protein
MRIRTDLTVGLLFLVLSPIAVVAIKSPAFLTRYLGGSRTLAPGAEYFLRIAGLLLLIGAVVTWFRLLKF